MIDANPVYSEDEKSATVSLSGVKMAGQFMLTLSINSSSSTTVEIPASFDVNGNGKCVGTLFDSLEPSNVNLFYNTSYTVVGVMSDEGSVFIEQDLEFSTMAEPTRVMNITRGEFVDTEKTTVDLSFVFVAAEKSSEYTFAVKSIESDETPAHATTFTVESDENGETKACRIGLYGLEQPSLSWNGQLKFEKEYEVVSFRDVSPSNRSPLRLTKLLCLPVRSRWIHNKQQGAPEDTHFNTATTHTTIHIARSQDNHGREAKRRDLAA
ncbi:hypothetical protein BLNAU_4219 [Blattamonas nauphoetae]|uniref:Uncharacterized protein n=1 Tax=Blattamonas nauphoetae TaxID=2049346 RepID=A0ABQ9YAM3_9EUKA|nr:hypothetical protein BLNAU_4219 [Blattamonas nauphoetae]